MKHISILVLQDAVLSSIDVAKQVFTKVNEFLQYGGQPPLYEIQLIGLTKETLLNGGAFSIHSDQLLEETEHSDLIIIPMLCGDFKKAVEANKEFAPWVIRQYEKGAELASFCVGAFFLASTGLLNGRTCAIHWGAVQEFRTMYPDVKVVDDKILTYEKGIYTSGGALSYLIPVLYLIERDSGREMAIFVSKMFEIDIQRKSQAPFMIFMGQKQHRDEPIIRAQEFIENNYQDKITTDQLTRIVALGRRNFERRFKKATSNPMV